MAGRPGNLLLTNKKNMDSSNIIWSARNSPLRFQNDLPKVVLVEDGYYSDNDDTTVSTGDVLTLHCVKKLRSYKAVSRLGQEIYIPTSIEAKIELVSSNAPKFYQTIEELVENGVERVQWMHATPWLKIDEGDVLRLHEVADNRGTKSVRMSFASKPLEDIIVPMSYSSKFKEISAKSLWLGRGKEDQFSYPVTIRIIDDTLKMNSEENTSTLPTLADLGQITLQGIHETEVFIASIKDEDNRIVIMKIPTTLDITVRSGVGMVGGEDDDYTYANVCQQFNKRARLENLNEDIYNSVRIGSVSTAVERIYDVAVDSDDDSDGEDYIEPGPQVPSREGRAPLQPPQPSSSEDEDSLDYEPVDDIDADNNNPEQSDVTRDEQYNKEERIRHRQFIDQECNSAQSGKSCCCFRNFFRRNSSENTCTIPQPMLGAQPVRTSTVPTTRVPYGTPLRYVDDRVIRREPLPGEKHEFQIPENLEGLSIEEVSHCLELLNLSHHIEKFKENQIDGQLLVTLDESMLVDLGVSNAFEKRKLVTFITGWRPQLNSQ